MLYTTCPHTEDNWLDKYMCLIIYHVLTDSVIRTGHLFKPTEPGKQLSVDKCVQITDIILY